MNTAVCYAPRRAWIRLPSGGRLDLINPQSGSWTDEDLAIRISRVYRWSGESIYPHPLSVAQHSLTVLALRRQWAGGRLSASAAMLELLHDAEEAFLGVDVISPLKAVLGDPFRQVSSRLFNAIADRYQLPYWQPAEHQLHKQADVIAAASEAVHCVGWPVSEVRNVLGIQHPILTTDPLAAIYDCKPWAPWPPEIAAHRFAQELAALQVLATQEHDGLAAPIALA